MQTIKSFVAPVVAPLVALLLSTAAFAQSADFSEIDTREELLALVESGQLERVLLVPAALGGEDDEKNAVYLPVGHRQIKQQLDGRFVRLLKNNAIKGLTVDPVFKGRSLVPTKIVMKGRGATEFNTDINVW